MHITPLRRESAICCAIASLAVASCEVESAARVPNASTAGHAAVPATATAARTGFWQRSSVQDRLLARGMHRDDAVRVRLHELAPELGLSESALDGLVLEHNHRLPSGGSIVRVAQRVHGVPVFQARASLVMDADQRVLAVGSQLTSAVSDADPSAFVLTPEAALAAFYTARSGSQLTAAAATRSGAPARDESTLERARADANSAEPQPAAAALALGGSPLRAAGAERAPHYTLQTAATAPRVLEATSRRVYFPLDGQLIAAYHVELLLRERGVNHAYAAVLDAADAQPLWAADLTAFEAFNYRVWAEADGTHIPTDGPLLDATPYPGAAPDRKRQDPRASVLVSMEGFNHNPRGVPDPWLSADATETLGNNVTAYTDRDAYVTSRGTPRRDGFTSADVRANVTAERTFDYTYDLARAPDADASQMKAAVTQVFYVNNWLHDFWYDSGFDEAAGNAQEDNFGRGGDEGDPLRAEAQDSADSGATNNANMSVLSDGTSPRMQMYIWNGLPVRSLVTEPALSFEDELGASSYGPQTFEVNGELALVDDGSTAVSADSSSPQGTVTDACQRMPALDDRIAVVERGGCTFVDKIANLERAGAKAVVILDNAPGHTAVNPSVEDPPDATLPLLALSYEDGQKLKALLQAANEAPPRAARFYRGPETMRDGTIDNTVVAHEWGHYLHHRLVSCASSSCGGMSEGWGDFVALMMVVRDGDSFDNQVFPLSQYATGGLNQNSAYFGTRRAPYSTDLSKNPFTFKHIREAAEPPTGAALAPTSPEMNEVHNVGEIWAAMLFEVYVNVIKAGQAAGRPFAESQRRMADYVVAGLKAAPVNPTFTQQRDALIAAVQAMASDDASRQADVEAFRQGFAKRGLGAGAVAPSSRSTTLNEAIESFDLQP